MQRPKKSLPIEAFNGETLHVSVHPLTKIQSYFEEITSRKIMAFGNLANGCHVRIQQLTDVADAFGLIWQK